MTSQVIGSDLGPNDPDGDYSKGAGTIVLLRHGRTAYNAQARLQGQVDIPLDDIGRWQAIEGANALAATHRADRLVTSDLSRAHATAAQYAQLVDIELIVDPRLRERGFGLWEGKSAVELAAGWPQEWALWRAGKDSASVGAEPRDEAAARVADAIREHAALTTEGGTLVVVSHGAAISAAVTNLLGLNAAEWRGLSGLNNVHWVQVERSRRGSNPQWRLTGFNMGPGLPADQWHAGPDWKSAPESA